MDGSANVLEVSPVSVCFTGRNRAGSWTMRGEQMATRRSNWHATQEPDDETIEQCEVFCFVKRPIPVLHERLLSLGKTVVFDVVDGWAQPDDNLRVKNARQARELFTEKWSELPPFDAHIFANQAMYRDLRPLTRRATWIYHHSDPSYRPGELREKVQVVGYEGNETYLGTWAGAISRLCEARGLRFVVNPETYSDMDIGFAAREGEHSGYLPNSYKSNVKLANFMATGTPCLLGETEISYHETDAGGGRFFATEAQLERQLEALFDLEVRRGVRENFLEAAKAFHIDRIAEVYEQFFLNLLRQKRWHTKAAPEARFAAFADALSRTGEEAGVAAPPPKPARAPKPPKTAKTATAQEKLIEPPQIPTPTPAPAPAPKPVVTAVEPAAPRRPVPISDGDTVIKLNLPKITPSAPAAPAASAASVTTATAPGAEEAIKKGSKEERAAEKAAKKARKAAGIPIGFVEPAKDGKIRLNLGSGDKHLPGYTNVDIAETRKGVRPDILCDLRAITLPDGHADEILSVHVIEHFYLWEIPDVLAEWKRVLKPGGRITLECPNLAHAAKLITENPDRLLDIGGEGWSQTMYVLYGDPAWKDPLMCHRWGWTPKSLGVELEKAGFVDVREEPAIFKKGPPRDMRVTAVKPKA